MKKHFSMEDKIKEITQELEAFQKLPLEAMVEALQDTKYVNKARTLNILIIAKEDADAREAKKENITNKFKKVLNVSS